MSKKKAKKSGFGSLMGVICGLLIAGYVILLTTYTYFGGTFRYTSSTSYLNVINRDEYHYVVSFAHSDRSHEHKNIAESTKQFYSVADYVEAAIMYKAYQQTGNSSKTEAYAAKIGEAEKGLGTLDFVIEDVNSLLDIR